MGRQLRRFVEWPANTLSSYTEEEPPAKAAPAPVETKTETVVEAEAPTTESAAQDEPNGQGDDQMYHGEQDMDDDIDFNLGGGNNYEQSSNQESQGPGIKEDG
jgi:RNA-binding protein Musashi